MKTRKDDKPSAKVKSKGAVREPSKKRLQKKEAGKRSAKKQGASRNEKKIEASYAPRKWGRYALIAIFLIAIGAGISRVNWDAVLQKAYMSTNRPLANIMIEGEFSFVSKQEIQDLIMSKLDGNFVELDLVGVKLAIEENAWVETVTIQRIWPDSLKVSIGEHGPIARWKDNGYINRDGELINVESNAQLSYLPQLSGPEDSSRELAQQYLLFSELLKTSELRVTEISVDKRMSWQVKIDNAFVLVLGRNGIQEKLEAFRLVYSQHLAGVKEKIKSIDMRYEKGLAVQWNTLSDLVAASQIQ